MLNIRSLPKHSTDIKHDAGIFLFRCAIILTETQLKSTDIDNDFELPVYRF